MYVHLKRSKRYKWQTLIMLAVPYIYSKTILDLLYAAKDVLKNHCRIIEKTLDYTVFLCLPPQRTCHSSLIKDESIRILITYVLKI